MTTSMRIQPHGLVTDPSRLLAGDGGLIVADNVTFKSPGLVEPRGRLTLTTNAPAVTDVSTFGVHARKWKDQLIDVLGSETATNVYSAQNGLLISLDAYSIFDRCYSEIADGRALFAFKAGLRCLDQAAQEAGTTDIGHGAFQRLPGAPRIGVSAIAYSGSATSFLGVNETTAYRVTLVRWIVDTAGRHIPVEGAPSDRYVIENVGGLAARVNLRMLVEGDIRMGDEIRVYRTPTNGTAGGDPGDEMLLRWVWKWDGTNSPSALIVDFDDQLSSDQWSGPALYTNASQEGLERSNYRLRTAADLSMYQNKLFYAGGSAGWRKSVIVKRIGEISNATSKAETLLSAMSPGMTVDWTNGSNVVSGVPAAMFPYLSVGQVVTGYDSGIVNSTPVDPNAVGLWGVIVSFDSGAGTITLDRDATETHANLQIIAWDWIGFTDDSENVYRVYAPWTLVGGAGTLQAPRNSGSAITVATDGVMPIAAGGAGPMFGAIETAFEDEYHPTVLSLFTPRPRMYSNTGANPSVDVTVTIEWDASFGNLSTMSSPDVMNMENPERIAITSSKKYAFSEELSPTFAESAHPANKDGSANTLWWSKINQPESVPLLNYASIGDASEPILRIVGTTDRLWILKTDGLWCAYGAGDLPDSITIQQVDPTCKMIRSDEYSLMYGQWVAKIRDTVYAWTVTGIFAIDSGGVRRIDSDIETDVRSVTPGFNAISGITTLERRPICCASERDGLVFFGGSNLAGVPETNTGFCYVYNVYTDSWAKWYGLVIANDYAFPGFTAGFGAADDGSMLLPTIYGRFTYADIPSRNRFDVNFNEVPVTGDVLSPMSLIPRNVTAVAGRTVTFDVEPELGSRFTDAMFGTFRVIAVSGSDGTVDGDGCAVGAIAEWVYPVVRRLRFSANQPPFTEKHFETSWASWQILRGGTFYTVNWRARGHSQNECDPLTTTYDDSTSADYPVTMGEDLEFDFASSTPTEVSRARGLEVTIEHVEADVYFALDGLTVEYTEETPRIEGGR